jgi:hypothetical protein
MGWIAVVQRGQGWSVVTLRKFVVLIAGLVLASVFHCARPLRLLAGSRSRHACGLCRRLRHRLVAAQSGDLTACTGG